MIKEYIPDNKKARKMLNKYHKKHDKWKKRKPVRIIMYLLCIIGPLLAAVYVYNNQDGLFIRNNEDLLINTYSVILLSLFLLWTPTIIYYKLLVAECRKSLTYKHRESLVLHDGMIKNSFSFPSMNMEDSYLINEIKYPEITRLVHNTYLERLSVYGTVTQTLYDDYGKNSVHSQKTIPNERLDFNLYYYDSDDFVKTVAEHSGVVPEVLDYFEE